MAKTNFEKNDETIKSRWMAKIDGWKNILTGRGVKGVDRTLSNTVQKSMRLTESENRQIYRSDFGAKVVNRPVDDMVREWFEITGDTDGDINQFLLNELCAQETLKSALTWGNVFGGSIVLMLIDDGATGDDALEKPLNENNIIEIKGLRVYDRWRATWQSGDDLYIDPKNPKFGTPQFYRITPLEPVPTVEFRVHESRVLRFDGPLTDDRSKSENNWWNDSLYQKGFQALSQLDGAYFSAVSIVEDFTQAVLKIDNLQNLIASGQEEIIKKRMEILDLSRHVIHTMLIDTKEEYDKKTTSILGLDEILVQLQLRVSAIYNIPLTLLMGTSPGGMNATGDADIRLYYDEIGNQQRIQLLKRVQRLVKLTMLSSKGPTAGKEIENWAIVFNPLWQPTQKEQAETRKITAESDAIYITNAVVDPNEVRKARFGGTEYSSELQVKGDLEPPEEDTEPLPEISPEDIKQDDNSPTDIVGDPILLSGVTSTDAGHKHDYFIADKVRGEGKTSLDGAGLTKHIHEIKNFTVMPVVLANGIEHSHTLPKSEPVEEINDPVFRG